MFPCRTEGRLLTICPDDFFRYIIIYIFLLTFFINFTFFPFLCLSLFPLFRNTFKKAVLKLCYSFMNKIPSPFYTVPLIFRGYFLKLWENLWFCGILFIWCSLFIYSFHSYYPIIPDTSCTLAHPIFEVFSLGFLYLNYVHI